MMSEETKYAQVLFGFETSFADEISANVGDVVQILYNVNSDWVYVRSLMHRDGESGILPANRLRALKIPENLLDELSSQLPPKIFISTDHFLFSEQGDLEFRQGEILVSEAEVDRYWLYGYLLNKPEHKGIFPVTHVTQVFASAESSKPTEPTLISSFSNENVNANIFPGIFPAYLNTDSKSARSKTISSKYLFMDPKAEESPQEKFCQVIYDFKAENENELSCVKGERLRVVEDGFGDGWIRLENKMGGHGLVPLLFVSVEAVEKRPTSKFGDILVNIRPKKEVEVKDRSSSLLIDLATNRKSKVNELSSFFENKNKVENKEEPSSVVERRDKNRPLIPPKLVKKESLAQSNLYPRPVIFNNELLSDIKNLETEIERRKTQKEGKKKDDEEVNASNLDGLERDLDDMKNRFIESSKNRELAMAQLNEKPSLGEAVEKTSGADEAKEKAMEEEEEKRKKKREKRRIERKYTINELLQTEREYSKELSSCYDTFMSDPDHPERFDRNVLFELFRVFVSLSNNLVSGMEAEMAVSSEEEACLAHCLIESADEMRLVYAKYLQQHPNLEALAKSYQSIPEVAIYIKKRLELLKDKKERDLAFILIKPVQRIFKYRLFLQRIIDNTEADHPDLKELKRANEVFTNMLAFINDYKRRKDMVSKYLDRFSTQSDPSLPDLVKKVNLKGILKKTARVSFQLTTIIGIFNFQVNDENFEREEAKFRNAERTVRRFLSDVNEFGRRVQEILSAESNIYNDLVFDEELVSYVLFRSVFEKCQQESRSYASRVQVSILKPVEALLALFPGPCLLIAKRGDKLVDYESALSDFQIKSNNGANPVSKEVETKLDQTKKDYDAINHQLIEDLAVITKKSTQILFLCATIFFELNRKFFEGVVSEIRKKIQSPELKKASASTASQVDKFFGSMRVCFNRREDSVNLDFFNPDFAAQTEEQRRRLKSNYAPDKLYQVERIYVADSKMAQLSQKVGDLVGVIKSYDLANRRHIWFVDNGETHGFIPCNVLKPYPINSLLDLDESMSLNYGDESYDKGSETSSVFEENREDEYCVALYDFDATLPNMIDLRKDVVYRVIEKSDKRGVSDWWLLELSDRRGYAPANHLKIID